MKFNVTVEYNLNEYEDLDEILNDKIAEQLSYRIINELGAGYKSKIEEIAKGIKKSITAQLIKEFSQTVITDELKDRINKRIESELNREFVESISDKVLKDLKPKVEKIIKTEANKSTEQIRSEIGKIFKL